MLVMELCTGGDMYARIPYTERQVAAAMRQVLSAVKYMHAMHFIHRDVSSLTSGLEQRSPLQAIVSHATCTAD